MSKSNGLENQMLEHILNNATIPLIGDAAGLLASLAAGNLYLSMHTVDPADADDQTTSETAYTGYARKAIARDGTGWTVTGNSASPQTDHDFPEATASAGPPLTHFGVGTAVSGIGKMLYAGALTPNIVMADNTIPRLKSTSTITEN